MRFVDQQVVEVATALFGTVLTNDGSSGDHFNRFRDAVCAPGLNVSCTN